MDIDGSLLVGVSALITSLVNAWRTFRVTTNESIDQMPQKPAGNARRSRTRIAMRKRGSALLHWRKRRLGTSRAGTVL